MYHTSNSIYQNRTHQVYVSVKLSPSSNGSPSQLVSRLESSESSLLLPFFLIPYTWPISKCSWYCFPNKSQPFGRNRIGNILISLFWSRLFQAQSWNTTMIYPNSTASCYVLIPEPRMAVTLLYPIWTTQPEIQGNLQSAPGAHLSFPSLWAPLHSYQFKSSKPFESSLPKVLLPHFYIGSALLYPHLSKKVNFVSFPRLLSCLLKAEAIF